MLEQKRLKNNFNMLEQKKGFVGVCDKSKTNGWYMNDSYMGTNQNQIYLDTKQIVEDQEGRKKN